MRIREQPRNSDREVAVALCGTHVPSRGRDISIPSAGVRCLASRYPSQGLVASRAQRLMDGHQNLRSFRQRTRVLLSPAQFNTVVIDETNSAELAQLVDSRGEILQA